MKLWGEGGAKDCLAPRSQRSSSGSRGAVRHFIHIRSGYRIFCKTPASDCLGTRDRVFHFRRLVHGNFYRLRVGPHSVLRRLTDCGGRWRPGSVAQLSRAATRALSSHRYLRKLEINAHQSYEWKSRYRIFGFVMLANNSRVLAIGPGSDKVLRGCHPVVGSSRTRV